MTKFEDEVFALRRSPHWDFKVKIFAWILRFVRNCRKPKQKHTIPHIRLRSKNNAKTFKIPKLTKRELIASEAKLIILSSQIE